MKEKDPRRNDRRKALRRRRFGPRPACVACGEREPVEFHHTAGTRNDPDLDGPICLNCHAKAHERLRDVGVDLSSDSTSMPEKLEAVIRSLATFFELLAEALERWADRLTAFVAALDAKFPGWRGLEEEER